MPGIIATLKANYNRCVLGQKVDDFSLAFITPLGPDNYDIGHNNKPFLVLLWCSFQLCSNIERSQSQSSLGVLTGPAGHGRRTGHDRTGGLVPVSVH
jgi:hypothetical protein